MMEIFHIWLVINSCVFMIAYFLLFLLLKYSYKKSILICSISIIIMILSEIVRIKYVFYIAWIKLVFSAFQIVVIQGTALLLAEKKDSYTFFIGLSSSNFVLGGNILSCVVLVFLEDIQLAMATCTITNILFLLWMVSTIREICRTVISKEISWWLCLVPCMSYVTFYLLLYFPVPFEQRKESLFAAISLILTVVLLYALVLKYVYGRMEEKWLLWKHLISQAYIKGIEVQSENIEAARKEFQIIWHDMRHKDNLLIELIQNQRYKEAEEILYKDIERLNKERIVIYCENVIINSVLSSMERKAKSMGIVLQIKSTVPKQQEVNDYELAMLVANLIENAINAVQKLKEEERIVKFMIKNRTNEYLMLEVKNLCDEEVKFSKKSGLPISKQGTDHGFGMISVQEFVKKYQAEFDCYMEEREFIVRILISFGKNRN